jgi:2-oxoglutarate ferredoxin oxidoreductase subunit alpha
MAIGAASAGVRAMCGTSGGGFSLMVEALGFAGMIEVPLVVVNSQRTGPSTGLPTKTEQGDLLFVMHASQGDFPRIVVAPRSLKECFNVGAEAFNLADRYQVPVIVLLDLFLSEHVENVDGGFDVDSVTIDRGKLVSSNTSGGRFKRYEITDDGVSPRVIPGTPGAEFIAPSDEHTEYGDLVSDALAGIDEYVEVRRQMNSKRMRKIDTMLKNENIFFPHVDGEGDYYFVTFGSTTDAAIEAIELLKGRGVKVGLISFDYLMPLDREKTTTILQGKKLIDVECNFTAQLAKVIMMNTGIDIPNRILKSDGEAITGEEIARGAVDVIKDYK